MCMGKIYYSMGKSHTSMYLADYYYAFAHSLNNELRANKCEVVH